MQSLAPRGLLEPKPTQPLRYVYVHMLNRWWKDLPASYYMQDHKLPGRNFKLGEVKQGSCGKCMFPVNQICSPAQSSPREKETE